MIRSTSPGPRVLSRSDLAISPWVRIVERKIDFGDRVETYHAVAQAAYIGILAVTPEGEIPIVRQYRPALERYTWELPAGMVDPGESPATTCRRELREETGLLARQVHPLGTFAADPARLSNVIHSFLVEAEKDHEGPDPELDVRLVTYETLRAMILKSELDLQYHVGVLGLVLLRPELAALLSPETAVRVPRPTYPSTPADRR